jgi:hypothetical protein
LGCSVVGDIEWMTFLFFILGIARPPDSVEFKILQRELYMADTHDKNFICRVRKILKKYALPPPESILDAPPKRHAGRIWYVGLTAC